MLSKSTIDIIFMKYYYAFGVCQKRLSLQIAFYKHCTFDMVKFQRMYLEKT